MHSYRLLLRAWLIFVVGAGFFAMGYVDSYDAWPSIETAIAAIERGTLELPKDPSHYMVLAAGKRGGSFTKLGLMMPALYVPAVVLGKSLCPSSAQTRQCIDFFVSWINPIAGATTIAVLFLFFVWVGNPRPWTVALAAGLGTMWLAYSKTSLREPVQALCLTAAYVLSMPSFSAKRDWLWLAAGAFLAAGVLVKQAFVVPALPCFLLWAHQAFQAPRPWRRLAWLFSPLLGALLVWAAYSMWAWGDPFLTGYSRAVTEFRGTIWRTPFWQGMGEQLFSLRKGLFVYNPLLLLFPYWVWRRTRSSPMAALDWAVVASFLAQAALYACWYRPTGDEALGPRYLLVVIPALFLLVGKEPLGLSARRPFAAAVALALVAGVAFQIVQASVKMQQYYTIEQRAGHPLPKPHWQSNLALFVHKVTGKPERYSLSLFGGRSEEIVDVSDVRSLTGLNYWWWHLARVAFRI